MMNEKNCNQCENHCPVDALQCGKGRRYFGLEPEHGGELGGRHEFEAVSGPIGYLRQCGHMLHHGGANGEDLLAALDAQEQAELERLLGKLLEDWKARMPAGRKEHRHGHHG